MSGRDRRKDDSGFLHLTERQKITLGVMLVEYRILFLDGNTRSRKGLNKLYFWNRADLSTLVNIFYSGKYSTHDIQLLNDLYKDFSRNPDDQK
jgi:hypothetical protein